MTDQSFDHLPQWRSHKLVRAAKIVRADKKSGEAPTLVQVRLVLDDGTEVLQPTSYRHRIKGGHIPDAVGGYFVVYEDGYASWSPAEAFEDGYTLIVPNRRPTIAELEAILRSEDKHDVTINPDGSITATPKAEA